MQLFMNFKLCHTPLKFSGSTPGDGSTTCATVTTYEDSQTKLIRSNHPTEEKRPTSDELNHG